VVKHSKRSIRDLVVLEKGRILLLDLKKLFMKYKQQALSKIEKLENQLKTLEMSLHRSFPAVEVQKTIDNIKEIVDSIRGTISIENDEWN
jgi:sugar-specific transcriptional regulator TrmB